jgi:hypothetical protein
LFYTFFVRNESLTEEDLARAVEAESTSLPVATDFESQAFKLAVLEARPKWIVNHDSFQTKAYYVDQARVAPLTPALVPSPHARPLPRGPARLALGHVLLVVLELVILVVLELAVGVELPRVRLGRLVAERGGLPFRVPCPAARRWGLRCATG